ncbi:hypothetical protein TcWFU_006116 [Taenia crassiceps]|uniref:Uncharacterized protein n=1 Tax=Taenia crassiceps TaxID=6207 RepID=A0ABR4Q265_9CEST
MRPQAHVKQAPRLTTFSTYTRIHPPQFIISWCVRPSHCHSGMLSNDSHPFPLFKRYTSDKVTTSSSPPPASPPSAPAQTPAFATLHSSSSLLTSTPHRAFLSGRSFTQCDCTV